MSRMRFEENGFLGLRGDCDVMKTWRREYDAVRTRIRLAGRAPGEFLRRWLGADPVEHASVVVDG